MRAKIRFRAVIFDMDGLVLDSEAGYFSAWQRAASVMGYQLNQSFCESLSGIHGPVISQRLLEQCGADFDIERFYRLSSQFWREQVQRQGIPVKNGFYALLQCIRERGLPYGLATNSRRIDAEACLALAGLRDVFPIIVSRDDVANPKPATDVFLKVAEAMGMASSDCLVLEDSPVGVAAAVAAACTCIFVPSCLPADPHASQQADLVMQDLAQVADFISAGLDHPL